jgi:hypothetical protein
MVGDVCGETSFAKASVGRRRKPSAGGVCSRFSIAPQFHGDTSPLLSVKPRKKLILRSFGLTQKTL